MSYELLMPFVVCASQGGPYHDASFVAGVRYGEIAERLDTQGIEVHGVMVEPALLPQLELLAMHLGYVLESEPWNEAPDAWVNAVFTRAAGEITDD